jgi:hypothetical protein
MKACWVDLAQASLQAQRRALAPRLAFKASTDQQQAYRSRLAAPLDQ